jgi:hypothetical protein
VPAALRGLFAPTTALGGLFCACRRAREGAHVSSASERREKEGAY